MEQKKNVLFTSLSIYNMVIKHLVILINMNARLNSNNFM